MLQFINVFTFWFYRFHSVVFRSPFFRSMAQNVRFCAYLLATTVPDTYGLILCCYPNWKQFEVEKKFSSYEISYKGEGKSKEPLCVGDEIVVFPSGFDFVRESQRNEKVVIR